MTFVGTITALSERFLRERTFDLVVAPAIADLQHDSQAGGFLRRSHDVLAVVSAFAWGVYEDATRDASALTFAALALIPACYYSLLVTICLPSTLFATASGRLTIAAAILVLSFGPVVACYWPERHVRRIPGETS
jgi:hypothetical protein